MHIMCSSLIEIEIRVTSYRLSSPLCCHPKRPLSFFPSLVPQITLIILHAVEMQPYANHLKIDNMQIANVQPSKANICAVFSCFLLDQKQNENKVLVLPPFIQRYPTQNLHQNYFMV